jgi:AraC family transcriptional regulator, regulatory protein of adaptative response / DNA-3-methyladenine glycosylase II
MPNKKQPPPLRRLAQLAQQAVVDKSTFSLPVTKPYDWPRLIQFLAARAVPGCESVESVENDAMVYRRTLRYRVEHQVRAGWIGVQFSHGELVVELATELATELSSERATGLHPTALVETIERDARRVFDTAAPIQSIGTTLGDLARHAPGLRLPGTFNPIELVVRAILGQQVTVKAARTLAARFVEAHGEAIRTPFPALSRLFPAAATIAALSQDDIGKLGVVAQRACAIIALANEVASDRLVLDGSQPLQHVIDQLRAVKGVGEWTANYIAMRALSQRDMFLPGDVALYNAMGLDGKRAADRRAAVAQAAQWAPYRSYAVMHLWRRLNETES